MRKLAVVMAVALALAGVWSAPAMANAIFDIKISVGWVDGPETMCQEAPSTGTGNGDCIGFTDAGGFPGTFLRLNWDDQTAGQDSFLTIGAIPNSENPGGPFDGVFEGMRLTTITGGQTIRSAVIRHENNVIDDEDEFLADIRLMTLLELSFGGIPVLPPIPFDPLVEFLETLNQAPCMQTNNPLGSVCDDRFTFDDPNLLPAIVFFFDGHTYRLSVSGLHDLAGNLGTCEDSADAGRIDCFTVENAETDRFVHVTLEKLAVPAPATLALLGLGLLGFGAWARSRRDDA